MFDWVLMAGLALSTPAPALESTPPAAPETILALPAELRARLQAEVIAGEPSRTRRFERLVNSVNQSHRSWRPVGHRSHSTAEERKRFAGITTPTEEQIHRQPFDFPPGLPIHEKAGPQ